MTCRRDSHGIIKAGVTFERMKAAGHVCRDCVAKDEVIRGLSDRLACLAAHLGMLAEREGVRQSPVMPPD